MKILNRYVLKEHAGPLTFAAAALTSLLLLNYIAKNIGQLVGKGLPWSVIAEFIGLSVPFTIAMTLPMAVLVSVLYAFSRLAAENEITALKASGVSLGRVLVPVVIGATGLTIFMILFNDQVLPRANHRLRTLQGDIARKKPTFALRARVLNEVSPGKLFLTANHLDAGSNRMREVVIYDLGDPTRERTIYADSGTMAMVPETGDLLMTLYDGNMDELKKAELGELQRLYYKVDHIRVRGVGDQLTRSTNDDYKSEREMSICEMQSDVADGAKTRAEARALASRALIGAVRTAATGAEAPRVDAAMKLSPAETRAPFGIGRAYCDAQASLLRFVDRHRAHPPGPVTPPAAGTPGTPGAPPVTAAATPGVHPLGGDTARGGVAVSIGHPPAGPPPSAATRLAQARPRPLPPSAGGAAPNPMPGRPIPGHPESYDQDKIDTVPTAASLPVHAPVPAPTHVATSLVPPPAGGASHAPAQGPAPGRVAAAQPLRAPASAGGLRATPNGYVPAEGTRPIPGQIAQGAPSASQQPPHVAAQTPVPAAGATHGAHLAGATGQAAPAPQVAAHFVPPSPGVVALQTLSNTVESADMRVQESDRNIALYDVEIQKKFAIAVACIIFVFLGAPIALRFPRGGVGMVLGVSLGVFALYYVGLIAGEPLGQRGTLTPFMSMWSSNIIFSILGAFLMANIGREGSTARGGDWGEMKDAIVRKVRSLTTRTDPPADTARVAPAGDAVGSARST